MHDKERVLFREFELEGILSRGLGWGIDENTAGELAILNRKA